MRAMNHNTQPEPQRLVIHFGKFGPLKYTSNLDLAKTWERLLRRADIPIQYSQGFNTRPRMALASALPLGITSECELLDVLLRQRVDPAAAVESLRAVSPEGLVIYEAREVALDAPSLQPMVRSAEYRIRFLDDVDVDALRARVAVLLAAETMMLSSEHKGKTRTKDMRPLIYALSVQDDGELLAHIAAGEHGNLRTEDLIAELVPEDTAYTVHRVRLHLQPDTRLANL